MFKPRFLSEDTPHQPAQSRKFAGLPAILLGLAGVLLLLVLGRAVLAQSGTPAAPLADPWAQYFCYSGMQCDIGDFNGDGKADIIQFNHAVSPAGAVYVALSNGSGFGAAQAWNSNSFCEQSGDICKVGDFNGDHMDDIIRFRRSTGQVSVALSLGYQFANSTQWHSYFCVGSEICDVGDYNGDGKSDIATFLRFTDEANRPGWVYVATSYGNGFGPGEKWVSFFCIQQEICGSGDFNGDGFDDIISFRPYQNAGDPYAAPVFVALSNGYSFQKRDTPWRTLFCGNQEICGVGDFNGDGADDIVTYLRSTYAAYDPPKIGYVYVALSDGANFPDSELWVEGFCIGNETCGSGRYIDTISQTSYSQVAHTGDFNGDMDDDVVTFLRSTQLSTKPGWVYVKLACGHSFLDFCQPPVTPTSTATPTVTNTPTITPTPSITPTPMPPRAWLPLTFR
jgi:hypothetical protein